MSRSWNYCDVKDCFNSSKNSALFGFPQDEVRKNLWSEHVDVSSSTRKKKFVCADHFDMTAFVDTLKKRLHRTAVPINEKLNSVKSNEQPAKKPRLDMEKPIPSVETSADFEENCTADTTVETSADFEEPSTADTPQSAFKQTPKSRKINSLQTTVRRLRSKALFQARNRAAISSEAVLQRLRGILQPRMYGIVASQIRNAAVHPRGRRWKVVDKQFALNVYLCSPAAYKVLSKFLHLPAVSTLRKTIIGVFQEPGMCDVLLKALETKLQKMKIQDRRCIVCLDEMAIRPSLRYLVRKDSLIGFEDESGRTRGEELATAALVFMVRGLNRKWKQVVGYYLTYRGLPGAVQQSFLVSSLCKLQNVGLDVIACVCDQGSNNIAMMKGLGVSKDKPYFLLNEKKIFSFYDPPHLLKAVRNNMLKYDVLYGEKKASWKHVRECYELDSKQQFCLCPKLSQKHVSPTNRQKMKVKLATQALSYSVGAAICAYTSGGLLSAAASETAEFVVKANDLFDTFNSSALKSKKKYLCAVSQTSCHLGFWSEMIRFVESWKFVDKNGKAQHVHCVSGWLVTISAAIELSKHLLELQPFILMRRINQDVLENTFSIVRSRRGCDDNPDNLQFLTCLRAISMNNLFYSSYQTNCEFDDDVVLASLDGAFSNSTEYVRAPCRISNEASGKESQSSIDLDDMNMDVYAANFQTENALFYISGYVAFKVSSKISCSGCISTLTSEEASSRADSKALFLVFKEFEEDKSSLKTPSSALFNIIEQAYLILKDLPLNKNNTVSSMVNQLVENVPCENLATHDECRVRTKKLVFVLLCKIFLFSKIKKINEIQKEHYYKKSVSVRK